MQCEVSRILTNFQNSTKKNQNCLSEGTNGLMLAAYRNIYPKPSTILLSRFCFIVYLQVNIFFNEAIIVLRGII